MLEKSIFLLRAECLWLMSMLDAESHKWTSDSKKLMVSDHYDRSELINSGKARSWWLDQMNCAASTNLLMPWTRRTPQKMEKSLIHNVFSYCLSYFLSCYFQHPESRCIFFQNVSITYVALSGLVEDGRGKRYKTYVTSNYSKFLLSFCPLPTFVLRIVFVQDIMSLLNMCVSSEQLSWYIPINWLQCKQCGFSIQCFLYFFALIPLGFY